MGVWLFAMLLFALAWLSCEKEAEEGGVVATVAVSPSAPTVTRGESLEFTALVNGEPSSAVTWAISTSGKKAATSISQSGLLEVSSQESLTALVVKATSTANPAVSGTARVKLTGNIEGLITGVTVTPVDPDVARGSSRAFSAVVEGAGSPSQKVTWSLVAAGKKSGTVINSSGVLTVDAAEALATLTVVATSTADTTKSGTTTVTVAPAAAVVSSVRVSPQQAEVVRGGVAVFSAVVEGTGEPAQTVIWDIVESGKKAGTSIDSLGFLTVASDEVLSALTVRAASTLNMAVFGTAQVTLKTVDPVVTRVTVSPASASVTRGGTVLFSAAVEGTGNPDKTVVWDIVESGRAASTTISAGGTLVVAIDETLSSLTVRARSVLDSSKTGTALVTVTIPGPVNHAVTFDSNGGAFAGNGGRGTLVVYAEHGMLVSRPDDPVKAGYLVNAWFLGSHAWDFDVDTVSEDLTLRAQWVEAFPVTFETFGGTAIDAQTVAKGGLVTRPADSVRAHYFFGGWYADEALNEVWNFASSTVRAATTLWARWTPESYTVTFDAAGGSTPVPPSKTVSYGESYGPLAAATRVGYELSGWYTAKDGGTLVNEDTQVTLSAAQTLYAHWITATYTVRFESNGGSETAEQSVLHGRLITKPSDPVKEDYAFAGWYKEASLSSAWNFATDTVTAALTLYAKWAALYTVTFNVNEGYPAPDAQIVAAGGKVKQPAAPAKEGYTFGGWYRDSGFSSAWNFDTDTVSSPLTLHAKWTEIPRYTVSFNSNGGSSVEAQVVISGGKVSQPASPAKEGYVFAGWYKEAALANVWNFGSDTVNANMTLYAKWTEVGPGYYTVSFNSNGGSSVEAQAVTAGGKVPQPASPAKAGYVFAGWYKEAALVNAWNFGSDTVNANLTLYAKWTVASYTLSYDAAGGALGGGTAAGNVSYGATVTLPSGSRTGYTLSLFTLSGAASGTKAPGATFTMPAGAVTATAVWTVKTYSLSYNANGGEVSGGTPSGSLSYGETVTLPTSGTRAGYTLSGFTLSGAASGTKAPGATFAMPAGAVTATANWSTRTYTLSYDGTGGNLSGGTSAGPVFYGVMVTLPTGGTKTGHTLSGFTLSGALTGEKAPGATFVMPAGDVAAAAVWTANSYTFVYSTGGGSLEGGTPEGSVVYGTTVTLPALGSKGASLLMGFTLSGAASGEKIPGTTFTMPAGTVTATANWGTGYILSYDAAGGTLEGGTPAGRLGYGQTVTLPPSGTKTGYTLTGFTLSGALGGSYGPGAAFTMPLGDVMVTAVWTLNNYTLSYDEAGGTLQGGTAAGKVDYDSTVTLPSSGTKAGYTLTSFTLSGALGGSYGPGAAFTMPTGDVTATAVWTALPYTLSYDAAGGKISGGTAVGSILCGDPVTLPSSGTKTGYTLSGFALSGDVPGGTLSPGATFAMPAADVTATAVWAANLYTLTYDAGSGTLEGGTPAGSVAYSQTITLPSSGTKEGYTLTGFTLGGATSGTKNPGATFVMPMGDVTATAVWTALPYTLSYDADGGTLSGGTPAGEIASGVLVRLPSSADKTGHTFAGFTLSGALSGAKSLGGTFDMPEGSVTVTAVWTLNNYTLTYSAAGGTLSGGTPAGSVAYGQTVTLPSSGTKTGYTFTSFTLSGGGLSGSYGLGAAFTMPAADVTATATWAEAASFNLSEGTGTGTGWSYNGTSLLTINNGGSVRIYGTTNLITVKAASGATASIKLDSASINRPSPSALDISGANVTLVLSGTSTLTSTAASTPAINVPTGATLRIEGEGALTATSGEGAAGIGSTSATPHGDITIAGGTVTTTGGSAAPGIGGDGNPDSTGSITISGGTVSATGGDGAAGIGGSRRSPGGAITITGGTVTATGGGGSYGGAGIGGGAAGVGEGYAGKAPLITISGGTITARGGGTTSGSGIGGGAYGPGGTITINYPAGTSTGCAWGYKAIGPGIGGDYAGQTSFNGSTTYPATGYSW